MMKTVSHAFSNLSEAERGALELQAGAIAAWIQVVQMLPPATILDRSAMETAMRATKVASEAFQKVERLRAELRESAS